MAYLTELLQTYSIPQDFATSQPLLELRTVHLHIQQKDKCALSHMKTFHMLILSYS